LKGGRWGWKKSSEVRLLEKGEKKALAAQSESGNTLQGRMKERGSAQLPKRMNRLLSGLEKRPEETYGNETG